jgi:hypothetical protein
VGWWRRRCCRRAPWTSHGIGVRVRLAGGRRGQGTQRLVLAGRRQQGLTENGRRS